MLTCHTQTKQHTQVKLCKNCITNHPIPKKPRPIIILTFSFWKTVSNIIGWVRCRTTPVCGAGVRRVRRVRRGSYGSLLDGLWPITWGFQQVGKQNSSRLWLASVTFLKVVSWPGCVAIIQLESCKLLYCLCFYCFHIIPNCFAAHSCDMDRYGAVLFSASACNWDTQISTHLSRAIGTDTCYDI